MDVKINDNMNGTDMKILLHVQELLYPTDTKIRAKFPRNTG